MPTLTSHYSFGKPIVGETTWTGTLNNTIDQIDTAIAAAYNANQVLAGLPQSAIKGSWSSSPSSPYAVSDIVFGSNGKVYIAETAGLTTDPTTATTGWHEILGQGIIGNTGPQGLGILAATITNDVSGSLAFVQGQSKTIIHGLATQYPTSIGAYVNDSTPDFDAIPSNFQTGQFILTALSQGIIDVLKVVDSSLVTSGTVIGATLNTNRVAYWPMNEGSGPTFNETVNGLTVASNLGPAAYSGATFSWVSGKASFAGYQNPPSGASTAGVSSLACLNNNGPVSISFGLNLGALTTPTQITLFSNLDVGATNGIGLIVGTNGNLQMVFINGGSNPTSNILAGATPAAAIGTGTRHRLIYTYDGSGTVGGINIYVDNVAKSISPVSGITNNLSGVITPSLAMVFMTSPSGGGIDGNNAAVGVVDDFSIWNSVISADQRALLT